MFVSELKRKLATEGAAGFCATFFENAGAAIEGFKAVVSVSDEEIRVRAGRRILSVKGSQLELSDVNGDEAYIKGKVRSIEVETRSEK